VGEHRVINHVTERHYSINELAQYVKDIAGQKGYEVQFCRGNHDPRDENIPEKRHYKIASAYIDEFVKQTPLEVIIQEILDHLEPYRSRVDETTLPPSVMWRKTC